MKGTLATILAHPDDETFGTGGTIIRYAMEGIAVHSLCLTEGEQGWAGGQGSPTVAREKVGSVRALELAEAGRRMGVASVTCLKYPDGGVEGVNEDYIVRDIVRWLRRVRPDVVITWGPDGGYGHPDHIATGLRALRAIELAGIARHEPELDDSDLDVVREGGGERMRALAAGIRWGVREHVADQRVDPGDHRDAGAAHVIGAAAGQENDRLDRYVDETTRPEVATQTVGICACAQRRRIAKALRDAAFDLAIPVVLIANEIALLVARLDDHEAVVTNDHDRDAVVPIARGVAREDQVLVRW